MSTLITNATIKTRRDTASNWTTNDPTLNQGEWGYETDTGKVKIGDGSTAWTSLGYYGSDFVSTSKIYEITDATNSTFTLPDASTQITEYNIKRTGSGAGTVTISPNGTDTIEGSTSDYIMRGDETLRIIPNGTNWAIVSTNEKRVCKAWGNFDGTLSGTITPRDAFNVTDITKTAAGKFRINFINNMKDTNYSIVGSAQDGSGNVRVFTAITTALNYVDIGIWDLAYAASDASYMVTFQVFGS